MTDHNQRDSRHSDETEKRGGYAAPKEPFQLPTVPAGPAQGATEPSSGTTPSENK